MRAFPLYPQRQTINLHGCWDFAWLEDASTPLADLDLAHLNFNDFQAVPGVFDTDIKRYGKRGVGIYRKRIVFPSSGRLRLRVGGLGLAARFFCDGKEIGATELAFSTFAIDFTPAAPGPQHDLVIAVDNRFIPQASAIFSPYFDFYGYGGIFRSLSLEELPDTFIERAPITTLDRDTGAIQVRLRLGGQVPSLLTVTPSFDSGDALPALETQPVNGEVVFTLQTPNPRLWSPEQPCLHTLKLTIPGDAIVERFGLRTIETCGENILLNGKPVFLKGVCRHEAHPQLGPIQNEHLIASDLLLLKNLGANFIRCVHYPQDQAFLDMCDETGFLVWQESMGWNNPEKDALDPHFFQCQVDQTRLMVQNSVNHPSIILWGFLNECCSHTPGGRVLHQKLAETIRAEDPRFLVTYACSKTNFTPEGKPVDLCLDLVDVVAFNTYPGWIRQDCTWTDQSSPLIAPEVERIARLANTVPAAGKPAIMSEIGCCALYGCHDLAMAQWSEEHQADYMSEACRSIFAHPRFVGLSLWQFCDSRSYVNAAPGVRGKPRGFNCAGLVDEYRRPKLAYNAVKEAFQAQPASMKA
ncbi:MAG TPA: glycoside hydrolase family 2 TIM barrel-domain containing protein [Lentisphaeria bacterium]|nr:hypothetical protein [Lentisphaerota bacterium]OQC11715.1 MAG: Beta-glucuronidase [Lentisphaerae bacterium ADurb.Bin082]HPY89978.1 glycoside hydrolase family 2 TIM barrel-domain containing protein [Lentisphaeria bacterium]HQL87237.1 glycoside hydrolase family 2 TIM barrel-domain containing protein [Lentisphaeria bacterium]